MQLRAGPTRAVTCRGRVFIDLGTSTGTDIGIGIDVRDLREPGPVPARLAGELHGGPGDLEPAARIDTREGGGIA